MQANNALSVACWVKLTIPSDTTLSTDMTLLGNRRTGDWNSPHAFRFYLNVITGNIEFAAQRRLHRMDHRRLNMTSRTTALGETATWTYAEIGDGGTNGHLTGSTLLNKPLKETRPATAEAPGGWDNLYTYDGAGSLLTHTDAIGTLGTHTYDARGLVTSWKDANNHETRFAYEATTGFLSKRTDDCDIRRPGSGNVGLFLWTSTMFATSALEHLRQQLRRAVNFSNAEAAFNATTNT